MNVTRADRAEGRFRNQWYCGPSCRAKAYRERQAEAARRSDAGESPEAIAEALGTTAATVRGWLDRRS